jgi:hypothetical protein
MVQLEKLEKDFLADLEAELKTETDKPESEQNSDLVQGLRDAIETIRNKK